MLETRRQPQQHRIISSNLSHLKMRTVLLGCDFKN